MIKIFTNKQIKKINKYFFRKQNIYSKKLKKKSKEFVKDFIKFFPNKKQIISIYVGTENNGAEGLSIGELLFKKKYFNINIKIAHFSKKYSLNFKQKFNDVLKLPIVIKNLNINKKFPKENKKSILIDALLGLDVNKQLLNSYELLIKHLNKLNKTIFSLDIPTGFITEGIISFNKNILKVYRVVSFQNIFVNFLLPESFQFINNWKYIDIGLYYPYIHKLYTNYYYIEKKDISKLLKKRNSFQNKWEFGHALIVAGNYPYTIGASLLCADACLKTGAGNTSACIPHDGLTALNIFSPEIMFLPRLIKNKTITNSIKKFTSIAVGPGLGYDDMSLDLLIWILKNYKKPIVIDADAINLISRNKELWSLIPENSLITPHVKEFDRLFGKHNSWWDRIKTIKLQSKRKKIIILLKNKYSIIGTPDGKIFFNSTGNPAMAVAGMGDVLTGILASLLAQGYSSYETAIIGVFIHGKSGDDLINIEKVKNITSKALINQIAKTYCSLL